jgi:hypothetical protein
MIYTVQSPAVLIPYIGGDENPLTGDLKQESMMIKIFIVY